MGRCLKCRRELPDVELQRLPLAIRIALYTVASNHLAAQDELLGHYCPTCRRVYSVVLVFVSTLVAMALLFAWLKWS